MSSIRFVSYNLLDYGLSDTAEELARREWLHSVIRQRDPDVLAVLELRAEGGDEAERAGELLRELAAATGLVCDLPDGAPAVALGTAGFHAGLAWRRGIEVLAWREWAGQFWHSMGRVVLDLGGSRMGFAAFHGRPFGKNARADEFERFAAAMLRPRDGVPTVAGIDGNIAYSHRLPDGRYFDADPFAGQPLNRDTIHQCRWTYDETGEPIFEVDRVPGEILSMSGLVDAAHATGDRSRTAGHWHHDHVDRRLDAILLTPDLADALDGYTVTDTPRNPGRQRPPAARGNTADPRHLSAAITRQGCCCHSGLARAFALGATQSRHGTTTGGRMHRLGPQPVTLWRWAISQQRLCREASAPLRGPWKR